MPEDVIVSAGDCIASIAFERGFFPDTVWDHTENANLKELRKNPNVLFPGDTVHIPDLESKEETGDTEKRHCFLRRGVPEILRVQFLDDGAPRKDESCTVDVDGRLTDTKSDADGWVEVPIPPNARTARVTFASGSRYQLDLGGMDPVTEVSGVQKRLQNLKLYSGPIDGESNAALVRSIAMFQQSAGLEPSGEMDEKTEKALEGAAG